MDSRTNSVRTFTAKPDFRPDIAALRALAVVAVSMFHFGVPGVPGGFVGVDVFFVISGFLMTSILTGAAARGRLDIVGFYLGRVRRIVPALVVVTLWTLAAGYALLLPDAYRQLAWDAVWADTFTINGVFARTNDYFAEHVDQSWFLHCWSLAVEIQFYLVIPFVVLGARRLAPKTGVWTALVTIAGLSLTASALQTHANAASAFYLPTTRAWEFAAGGLVSTLRPLAGRRRFVAAGIGLILILGAVSRYNASLAYPGLWPLAPVVGTALVIWGRPGGSVVSARPVQYLGNISYSVYMWHWPVLLAARALLPFGGARAIVVEVVASLLLSAITYRFVECPFRARGRGTRRLAAIALGLGSVALASGAVIGFGGLPGRIPADILRATSIVPAAEAWRSGACFLRSDQGLADLAPECLSQDEDPRPKIMLWGDSTIADLYPGIMSQRWAKDFAVEQATAASCSHYGMPQGSGLPHCREFQAAILDRIMRSKPDYVLISMSQTNYSGDFDPASRAMKLSTLDPTSDVIRKLKTSGIQHVIVVGPAPIWPLGMPTMFARHSFQTKKLEHSLPMDNFDIIKRWDAMVRVTATSAGAEYLSLIDQLCSDKRCLSLVPGQNSPALMQFDTLHFSAKGAAYIANHYIGPLIGKAVAPQDQSGVFDPVRGDEDPAEAIPPPSALPQHYPIQLGRSFEINAEVDIAHEQVPYATVLQNYDADQNGFSVEFTAPGHLTFYTRMEDRTLYAAQFDVPLNAHHTFHLSSADGHPVLSMDGKIVAQTTDQPMMLSRGTFWVGGSGLYAGRNLNGKLTGLSISGDVQNQ